MSFLLYTGQIVDALAESAHPLAAEYKRRLCELNREAAEVLAAHLGVKVIPDELRDFCDENFAAAFKPARAGQHLPPVLAEYDTESEWADDSEGPPEGCIIEPHGDGFRYHFDGDDDDDPLTYPTEAEAIAAAWRVR